MALKVINKSFLEQTLRDFKHEVLDEQFIKVEDSFKILPISEYHKKSAYYPQSGKVAGVTIDKYDALIYNVSNLDSIYVTLSTDNRTTDFSFVLFLDAESNIKSTACKTKVATDYVREKIKVPTGTTRCILVYLNSKIAYAEGIVDISVETPISNIKYDGGFSNVLRKVGILGDSLSCGALDTAQTAVDNWDEYSWAQFMSRRTGCDLVKLARGGIQIDNWKDSFSATAQETANKCDSYFIMLGHNDQGNFTGNINDVDISDLSQSANTTYGKLGQIVGIIKQASPKAKIFFITYPIMMCEHVGINTMIREVCNKVGGYLIDLYAYDKKSDYYSSSTTGVHMNPFGYYNWATEIMTYTDYIIRNNMDDFREIGYATKDYTLQGN